MDTARLKFLLTSLTGSEIGVKWMKISSESSSKKDRTAIAEEPTKALVLEGPQDNIYELRELLSTCYGSKSTSFPDAVRMRLIPPLDALSDANRQENYGAALAKQASFMAKMGKGSSWEFSSNLILDKPEPTTGLSIRQLIMAIPSSQHPNLSLFHCINCGWKEGSTVVFHFLPSNEGEARMYISGLIAYLRATALPWYQDLFKPLARSRSNGTTLDPDTRQITSVTDSNFTETLQQDPLYDLTYSSAALLSSSTINLPDGNSFVFEVPNTDGSSLRFDTDSISTFRSTVRSAFKKKKNTISTPPTVASTPTQSVTFAPFMASSKLDDMSISKMSDTASKVANLETRFDQMENQFSSSFARLESILSGLGTQGLYADNSSTGNHKPPEHSLANPPAPDFAGGSNQRAAGHGS
jgi:hypothetical protein